MCVMCVGSRVDMDSHPDACLCCIVCCTYWIVGRHGNVTKYACVICVGLWVDVGMSPVCVICWIVGRPGASPHEAMWGEWPLHYQPFIPL